MSFVLFVLGVAAAAAGVLMIGFGIPINEFSLGNTLIIAGTTALASGLVVIGLVRRRAPALEDRGSAAQPSGRTGLGPFVRHARTGRWRRPHAGAALGASR